MRSAIPIGFALISLAISGCATRTIAEIKSADPRDEIEVRLTRAEAVACVVRQYEATGGSVWVFLVPLTTRDFPSENLTELFATTGTAIQALADVRGTTDGALVTVYRPANVLPQTTNDRLVAAAQSCQQRNR